VIRRVLLAVSILVVCADTQPRGHVDVWQLLDAPITPEWILLHSSSISPATIRRQLGLRTDSASD